MVISQKNESFIKVLIATSSTGNGHNVSAIALKEWAEYFLGSKIEVKIEQLLENSNLFLSKCVDFYNFIQRKSPWFHHIYYNIIELQEMINPGTVSLGSDYYIHLLREFQPHVLISVHDALNKGYFELGKKIIGSNLHCVTYCLEFQGGYGFSRNWVNTYADMFCCPTQETAQEAISRGMNPNKVFVSGILLRRCFYESPMNYSEKTNFLVNDLGLRHHLFTLLLSTGGAGAENHISFLNNLLPMSNVLQVIALCGSNISTREKLTVWRHKNPNFNLCVLPFTQQIHKLLQVSSAVVTRPGGITSYEALHLGCPIIFNGLGGIMPQELLTVSYFKCRNIAVTISRAEQLAPILQKWLSQPETYVQICQKLLSQRIQVHPEKVITQIISKNHH
ncbi:MAG: glycosyltransferase [Nostoc sp.]|uniref:MGDG synthase family glycosyltransferase n=1 Tax=Nostoc sp. TaxID=1180 RepID=UPI002FF16ED3